MLNHVEVIIKVDGERVFRLHSYAFLQSGEDVAELRFEIEESMEKHLVTVEVVGDEKENESGLAGNTQGEVSK